MVKTASHKDAHRTEQLKAEKELERIHKQTKKNTEEANALWKENLQKGSGLMKKAVHNAQENLHQTLHEAAHNGMENLSWKQKGQAKELIEGAFHPKSKELQKLQTEMVNRLNDGIEVDKKRFPPQEQRAPEAADRDGE